MSPAVTIGLEALAAAPDKWVRPGERVALLYNTASVTADLVSARDVVRRAVGGRLVKLFGPQHGVNSDVQDNMVETSHAVDARLGLPVYSLYGEVRKPTAAMLEGIDVLLVDLVDVGTRVYTFIWTLMLVMEACGECGVRVVVLDRPNPIGGERVEGNLLSPEFASFVGLKPIPMRHGMTVGELARWFARFGGVRCELDVVEISGWSRRMSHPATGRPWVMPSPNMPAFETALVYPGAVLLEGTTASEGRGTTRPFECFGGPWGKPEELSGELNRLGLPGVLFRPVVFEPTFQKWAGRAVNGAFMHVTGEESFEPYLAGLAVLSTLWRLYHDEGFDWREGPYEYEFKEMPIHLLLGSRELREALEAGAGLDALRERWCAVDAGFMEERKNCLIY